MTKVIDSKMTGITMVAPPRSFKGDPFVPIKNINAEWVALVPYAFTRQHVAGVRYQHPNKWWGETPEGIAECIDMAHKNGQKVFLKPQVFIPGSWVGDMDFETEAEWLKWEKEYRAYILTLVEIARQKNVAAFCVGTEYKIATRKRETFWRSLIKEIRGMYSGLLLYSSNWDNYEEIPFWDALDLIGISAYFPLTEDKTPSITDLKKAWKPIGKKIKKFARRNGKQILFTEYGYLSIDGCAYRAWELEKKVKQSPINEQAQSNAYQALLEFFSKEEYWAGGFLWKWFPEGMGHEGYVERDYTPQGKIAEQTIARIYGKMNQTK